jgi:hypothetical protein
MSNSNKIPKHFKIFSCTYPEIHILREIHSVESYFSIPA